MALLLNKGNRVDSLVGRVTKTHQYSRFVEYSCAQNIRKMQLMAPRQKCCHLANEIKLTQKDG